MKMKDIWRICVTVLLINCVTPRDAVKLSQDGSYMNGAAYPAVCEKAYDDLRPGEESRCFVSGAFAGYLKVLAIERTEWNPGYFVWFPSKVLLLNQKHNPIVRIELVPSTKSFSFITSSNVCFTNKFWLRQNGSGFSSEYAPAYAYRAPILYKLYGDSDSTDPNSWQCLTNGDIPPACVAADQKLQEALKGKSQDCRKSADEVARIATAKTTGGMTFKWRNTLNFQHMNTNCGADPEIVNSIDAMSRECTGH